MNEPVIEPLVPVLIVAFFAVGLALERIFAARSLPKVRGWQLRAWISWVFTFAINGAVPMGVAVAWAGLPSLGLDRLGLVGGALVTLLVTDFLSYWVHRLQHRSPAFWRWTHQLHHSAERVDVVGAAWFHPFDIGLQAAVGALAVMALGVSPDAAALGGLMNPMLAVFQHLNVRTPVWLGYVLQRPEGHSVHHERGVHAYNYGNLSVWDLAFGTFRNPRDFAPSAGFYDGASARVVPMLLGRDVSTPSA